MNSEMEKSPSRDTLSLASEKVDEAKKNPPKKTRFIGLLFCFLYTLCMSSNVLVVKSLSIPASQKLLGRCSVQFLLLLPLVTWGTCSGRFNPFGKPGMFKMLILRGISTTLSSLFMYEGISRIPMGDASSISFCSIFFSGIIARLWLKEPYTKVDMLFACLSMVGVLLISKPPFMFHIEGQTYGASQYVGIMFALLAALSLGFQFCVTRRLGKVDPILVVFYFSVFGMIIPSIYLFAANDQVMPCYDEVFFMSLIGITGFCGQFFLVLALRFERTTTFAIMRSTTIFQVFLLQVFVMHDIPDALSIGGASMIFVSAFGIALRKLLKESRESKKD